MVIDEERREYVYMADQPGKLKKRQDVLFDGLVDAKSFASDDSGTTVMTLQQTPSGENPIDRYPAKIRAGRRFEEISEFCEEIHQEAREQAEAAQTGDSCENFTTEEVKLLKEVAAAVANLRSRTS